MVSIKPAYLKHGRFSSVWHLQHKSRTIRGHLGWVASLSGLVGSRRYPVWLGRAADRLNWVGLLVSLLLHVRLDGYSR